MSTEKNKEIVRRYIEEAVSQGHLDRTGEFVADTYVRHDPSQPAEVRGLAALTALNARLRAPIPDLQLTIEDLLAEGDKVVTRLVARHPPRRATRPGANRPAGGGHRDRHPPPGRGQDRGRVGPDGHPRPAPATRGRSRTCAEAVAAGTDG